MQANAETTAADQVLRLTKHAVLLTFLLTLLLTQTKLDIESLLMRVAVICTSLLVETARLHPVVGSCKAFHVAAWSSISTPDHVQQQL